MCINIYKKELTKLTDSYKKELLDFEKNNLDIKENQMNYYNFLKSSANGKCNHCGQDIKIIKIKKDKGSIKYFLKCNHNIIQAQFCESISISESLEGKTRDGIKGKIAATLEQIFRINKMSKDKEKHPENVDEEIIIDKVNNKYYQKVTDRKTGNIIHEENQKLTEHKFGHK